MIDLEPLAAFLCGALGAFLYVGAVAALIIRASRRRTP